MKRENVMKELPFMTTTLVHVTLDGDTRHKKHRDYTRSL